MEMNFQLKKITMEIIIILEKEMEIIHYVLYLHYIKKIKPMELIKELFILYVIQCFAVILL